MFGGIFDCGQGADDALVVGDFGVGFFVEGNVEVDLGLLLACDLCHGRFV